MNRNISKVISEVSKSAKMDIGKRWENGTEHNEKAEILARLIGEIDYEHGGDTFCLKFGGDGDQGEHLIYLLSEIFEQGLLEKVYAKMKTQQDSDDD